MPLVQGGLAFGQTFAGSTYGSTITGGTSGVMGTPVELIAATAHDAQWIEVMVGNPSTTISAAVDILIGAATEAILIPKLIFKGRAAGDGGGRWLFPVFIPKGSRIAARLQSFSASPTCLVGVVLFNSGIGAHGMPTNVIHYGTITAPGTQGVNVDPGAVAHTKSTPVQITAATARDHHWLVLTIENVDATWASAAKKLIDVMIGSSTETALVANLAVGGAGTADKQLPEEVFHLPVFVPKGSRLSVRAQCSSTTDVDRDIEVTLHGA